MPKEYIADEWTWLYPYIFKASGHFRDADFNNFQNRSGDIVDKANGVYYIIDNEFSVVL